MEGDWRKGWQASKGPSLRPPLNKERPCPDILHRHANSTPKSISLVDSCGSKWHGGERALRASFVLSWGMLRFAVCTYMSDRKALAQEVRTSTGHGRLLSYTTNSSFFTLFSILTCITARTAWRRQESLLQSHIMFDSFKRLQTWIQAPPVRFCRAAHCGFLLQPGFLLLCTGYRNGRNDMSNGKCMHGFSAGFRFAIK